MVEMGMCSWVDIIITYLLSAMRQSYFEIKIPAQGLRRQECISPPHKSPLKPMEKQRRIPRSISPSPYLSPAKPQKHIRNLIKITGSPPKYICPLSPKPPRIKPPSLPSPKQQLSQQTAQSSRTASQLEIIKSESSTQKSTRGYDLSAIGSDTSDLPVSIKQQPNFMLFLCTNCYEYFMLPERGIHTTTCVFEPSEHEINIKINKIIQVIRVIDNKHPDRFLKAIASKLQEYQSRRINMEDILLFEMLIVKSEPNPDLNWKQLFWAIKELMKIKEKIRLENIKKGWMFCK